MLGVSYGKLYLLVVSLYNSHKFNSYGRLINVKIAQLDVFNVTLDTFEDVLFDCFFFLYMSCVTVAGIKPQQIACIGISTQRSSFITWHRETGKPFHNFITWKDVRADGLVRQWNESFKMKVGLFH
jgi:putative glycerol kinase 5